MTLSKKLAEWVKQLEANPNLHTEWEENLRRRELEYRIAEAPLVEELNGLGVHVSSVWDLVNTAKPYPEAIPLLLDHLCRAYPDRILEGIARALAVPDASGRMSRLASVVRYRLRRTTR
jgi:hypothetical protein